MVSTANVRTYLKAEATFLGTTLVATATGGVIGSVVAGVISLFTGSLGVTVPLVSGASIALPGLGASLGFATGYIRRILA